MLKSKVVVQETETEIIVRIPKVSAKTRAKKLTETEALKIVAQAEKEFKDGRAKPFRSIRELLASSHGQ